MATLEKTINEKIKELGISGYDNVEFSPVIWNTDFLSARLSAEQYGGRLQSLKDAIVYLVATEGDDNSNEFQLTSDMALFFKQGGVNKVAFVDGYDFVDRQNRSLVSRYNAHSDHLLPRRKRGFKGWKSVSFGWYLPMAEFCPYGGEGVNVWRDEISETGRLGGVRVFDVPDEISRLSLRKPSEENLKNGAVYFGNYPILTNLLTPRVAEVYSDILSQNFIGEGCFGFPSQEVLGNVPEGSFLCRSVLLCCCELLGMTAENNYASTTGFARGVVKPKPEVSDGNS